MSEGVISLAERLKQRRAELGLSQAQAARELDVARTAYRLWEMEAAKPSPDRWRLIARWLGVSMATMLVADDVIEPREAALLESVGELGDGAGSREDFFAEQRRAVSSRARAGHLSHEQEGALVSILERVERSSRVAPTDPWPVTSVSTSIAADPSAPRAAREAMRFAASSVPVDRRDDLLLLVSEAVTQSVREGEPTDQPIQLSIAVGRETVRVEVSHRSPTPVFPIDPEGADRFAVVVLAAIASRWGAGRVEGENVTWFEVDVPPPGTPEPSTAGSDS